MIYAIIELNGLPSSASLGRGRGWGLSGSKKNFSYGKRLLQMTLAISLLFGLGQIVAGAVLVWRLLAARRWTHRNRVIGALAGIWLLVSGGGECLVAGAEALHRAGIPALRAHVDAVLLGVTVALFVALAAYLLVMRAARLDRVA